MIAGCGGGKTDIEGNGFFDVTADGSSELSTTKLNFHFYEPITGFSADNITLSFSVYENGESKSGQSVVKKGTLSGSGQEYVLPISGFSSSGNLEVKVEISDRTGYSSVYIYYYPAKEGIYIGIIKFAGNAEAINLSGNYNYYLPGEFNNNETNSDAPVLLDQSSKQQIDNRINDDYRKATQPGTAVYYAVHKALANLSSSENRYPDNLDSVYVITFTDGLDNMSSGQSIDFPIENKPFNDTPSYVTYVKNEIANRKIKDIGVTAYSIGLRGSDVTDIPGFQAALKNIASSGKDKELNNYNDIQSTFNEIAEGLIQGSNFTLTTTLLDSGTKVRMTFDVNSTEPTDAASSTKYIEGIINRSGNTYTFTNITYAGGISSSEGTGPITGTRSSGTTTVNFLFSNIIGYDFATDRPNTKQWTMVPGALNWNINSEYSSVKTDLGTTVIYLVLDCSTSMSDSDISKIRDAVRTFINKIYSSRYENGY